MASLSYVTAGPSVPNTATITYSVRCCLCENTCGLTVAPTGLELCAACENHMAEQHVIDAVLEAA